MQMVNTVVVGGWTLLVATCGGYSRSGDDFRTEVFLLVEGKRVFSQPQLRFPHPDETTALAGHRLLLSELAERYEIVFGQGQVFIRERKKKEIKYGTSGAG